MTFLLLISVAGIKISRKPDGKKSRYRQKIAPGGRFRPIAFQAIRFQLLLTPKDTDERRLTPRYVSVHPLLSVFVSVKK
jgi:hypothetical protein